MKVLSLEGGVVIKNYGCNYLQQLVISGVSHYLTLLQSGLGVWRDSGSGVSWQSVYCIDIQAIRSQLGDSGALYIRDFAVASRHCCSPYEAMLAVAIDIKVYIVMLHEGRWDLLHVVTTDKIINKVIWSDCAIPTLLVFPIRGSPVLIQLTKRRTKIEQIQLFDSALASRYGSTGCIPTSVNAALFCSNSGTISLDDNNTDPAIIFLNGLNSLNIHNTPLTRHSDNLVFSNSVNSLNKTFSNNGQIRGVCADMSCACVCISVEVNQNDNSLVGNDEFVLKLPTQLEQTRVIAGIKDLSASNHSSIIEETTANVTVNPTMKTGSFRHALASSTLLETLRPDVDAAAVSVLRLNIADKKESVPTDPQDSQLLLYHLFPSIENSQYSMKYATRVALRNLPARPDIIVMKALPGSTEGLIAVASSIDSVVNVLTINYTSYNVAHSLYFDLLDYRDEESGKQSRILCKGLQFSDDCSKIYAYGSWKASTKSTLASVSTGTVSSCAIYALDISKRAVTPAAMQPSANSPTPVPSKVINNDLLQLVLSRIDGMDSRLNERLQRIEQRLDELQRDVARVQQAVRDD
jgi:hypothetical protein